MSSRIALGVFSRPAQSDCCRGARLRIRYATGSRRRRVPRTSVRRRNREIETASAARGSRLHGVREYAASN